jgi:hypothetical protein
MIAKKHLDNCTNSCYNIVSKIDKGVVKMARTKAKSAKSWERLIMLMVKGGPVTKQDIENNIEYDFMYRLSSLMFEIKLHGGVIKVQKDGRKVVSYELINIDEMKKYLTNRGLTNTQSVGKLSDLNAKPAKAKKEKVSADVATAEVDVIEVTEVTE